MPNDLSRAKTPKVNDNVPKPHKPPLAHKNHSNIS